MRVLVTNDDGVGSEGLWALAREVRAAGHELVVAAPMIDMTGMGGALGGDLGHDEIRTETVQRHDLGDTPCFAVDGPPALCVILTQLGAFGDPVPMVVSGVNPGVNCGRSAFHSGTVGAAITAANNGAHGIATSIDHHGDRLHWATATALVPQLIELLARVPRGRRVVNVNAPNLPLPEVGGVERTGLAKWGDSAGRLAGVGDGRFRFVRTPGAREPVVGTDHAAVKAGRISVSELRGIQAVESPEVVLDDLGV